VSRPLRVAVLFCIATIPAAVGAAQDPTKDPTKRLVIKVEKLFDDPGKEAFIETRRVSNLGRIAMVVKAKGGQQRALLDGKLLKPYTFIVSPELMAAAQAAKDQLKSGQTAASALAGTTRVFRYAPDDKSLYYVAYTGKGYVVAHEKGESEVYQHIMPDMPIFSPDGKRWGFVAYRNGRWRIVLDGKEVKDEYDDFLIGTLVFSPNSKRMTWCARKGGLWHVFHDQGAYKGYEGVAEGTPVFSPNSEKIAYVAFTRENRQLVMLDSQKFGEFDMVADQSLQFTPDSKSLVFAARFNHAWYAYINTKAYGPYEEILEGTPLVSKDSKRIVWVARTGGAWQLFENGAPILLQADPKAGRRKDAPLTTPSILKGTPLFSPDGKKLVFAYTKEGKWVVWEDGVESKGFDDIRPHSFTYTRDSSKLVYIGVRSRQLVPVINQKELDPCLEVGPIRVSRGQGTGTAAFAVRRSRTPEQIREAAAKNPKDRWIGDKYWTICVNGEDLYGPFHDLLPQTLTVSDHGLKFACPAFSMGKWGIFVNGERRGDEEAFPFWIRFHPDTHMLEMLAVDEKRGYVVIREAYE
jgi:hypothetical protein